MAGVTVLVAICAAGIVFLVYAFAALCKENRRGACSVVKMLRNPEQEEFEISRVTSGGVIQLEAHAQSRRDIRAGGAMSGQL